MNKDSQSPGSFISNTKTNAIRGRAARDQAAWEKRELLEELREVTSLNGIRACFPYKYGYPWPKKAVEVALTQSAGTYHCGNRHACPVCTSAFMAKCRDEFVLVMKSWTSEGGFLVGQTLTLANSDSIRAPQKYFELTATWGNLINRPSFKRAFLGANSPMMMKVLEEQLGEFGWFPHFHLIWFFEQRTQQEQAQQFLDQISRLWCDAAHAVSTLGATMTGQYIFEIDQESPKTMGRYVTKHAYHDLGFLPKTFYETHHSLSAFEAFRTFAVSGDLELLRRWIEFEVASAGRGRVKFSRSFRLYLNALKTTASARRFSR